MASGWCLEERGVEGSYQPLAASHELLTAVERQAKRSRHTRTLTGASRIAQAKNMPIHGVPFVSRAAFSGLVFLLVIASQVFWIQKLRKRCAKLIPNPVWRHLLGWSTLAAYLFLFAHAMPWLG